MMLFTSIYNVVDGFFISNFVGITEFASVNLIFPAVQILSCIGFMFGAGGAALVSKTLGEQNNEKANRIFSMLTYIALGVSAALALVGILFLKPIASLMGADEQMLPYCVQYGTILLLALPAFMLQIMFQSFLITAERPTTGLLVTVFAGLTNAFLDVLFIAVFDWGVMGAAGATALAQCVGGFVPLFFFTRKNKGLLRLGKTNFDGHALLTTCTNGLSELVNNISMSVVAILYNLQLMKLAGENGVAAYGAVMYISFAFVSIFIGYSIGVAPVIGYHYGAENSAELKNLFKKSNILISLCSIALSILAFSLASPLARVFVDADEIVKNPKLLGMTMSAFRFYAISVLFSGFSIFGSSFFTALNNGVVSAAISFLRTLVFQIATVLILPIFFGVNGVWYSLSVAEFLAMVVTVFFFTLKRKIYHY